MLPFGMHKMCENPSSFDNFAKSKGSSSFLQNAHVNEAVIFTGGAAQKDSFLFLVI
jgi:hypothetical protein